MRPSQPLPLDIPQDIDVYTRMTKTVRLEDEVHEELRRYMERRGLSSFG